MTYQQLTEGKRYQISILLAQGYWPAFIAKTIDVHRSTVYRELDQNRSKDAMNTVGFHSYIFPCDNCAYNTLQQRKIELTIIDRSEKPA